MRTLSSLAATATTFAALLLATGTAGAAGWPQTLVVDQTAGPYTTIGAAIHDAIPGDTVDVHAGTYTESVVINHTHEITIHGEPGAIVQAPPGAPFAFTVSGTSVTLDHLTINGGDGGVLMTAFYDAITNSTVTAPNTAVEADGPFAFSIDRSILRATAPSGVALRATSVTTQFFPDRIDVATSVLAGGSAGAGLALRGDGTRATDVAVAVTLTSSTVAGAPSAWTSVTAPGIPPNSVTANNSIVHGAAPGLTGWRDETTASDAATFAGGGTGGDFHLCYDAPAVGYVDARPRPASLTGPRAPDFDLTTDLDGAPRSGDGRAPGAYLPSATCAEPALQQAPRVITAAKDVVAPTVRITSPGAKAKVRRVLRGKLNRVRVGGRAADAGGLARVQLVLRQQFGRHGQCRFADAAKRRVVVRSCKTGAPPAATAVVHGGTWSWTLPAGVALRKGAWAVQAVAVDRAGNTAAKVMHFTVT